jgi:hypothetical protein
MHPGEVIRYITKYVLVPCRSGLSREAQQSPSPQKKKFNANEYAWNRFGSVGRENKERQKKGTVEASNNRGIIAINLESQVR